MRLYRDMSFKEISENTRVSINTALGRMRYAIINLRKLISEHKIVLEASQFFYLLSVFITQVIFMAKNYSQDKSVSSF